LNDEIFVIGCWTDTKEKEQNLISVIKDIKSRNYPICLVAHYPISKEIQELADYFIFEKENVLSHNWRLTFWRIRNGIREEKASLVDYHAVACLMNIRNAVDLLKDKEKFQYIHYREADLEYDFDSYMKHFNDSQSKDHVALFIHYQDEAYRTDLFSCDIDWYNLVIPRVQSWEEYVKNKLGDNLILEYWFSEIVNSKTKSEHITFIKDFKVRNKWTQAHYVEWDDDPRPKLDFADAPEVLFQSQNRQESFIKVLTLLYNNKKELNPNIVEIGVTRQLDNIIDGDSTSIWAWYISKYGGSYHGCDISRDNLKICEQVLKRFIGKESDRSVNVALTCRDGVEFLRGYNRPIDLLYLDTIDWEKGSHESGIYHLKLILEAINKIKIGGYVMFDDTFNVDTYDGKAEIAIPYLLGSNNFSCIHKGYQFIFRRDI